MMNVRVLGDFFKIIGLVILPLDIVVTQSCAGVSLKTQICYVVIHVARYLDLYYCSYCMSQFSFIAKIVCIIVPVLTVLSMMRHRETMDFGHDNFRFATLLIPCAILSAFGIDYEMNLWDRVWVFSMCLEAVAILPQLRLMDKKRHAPRIILLYVSAFILYRIFYLLHYAQIYRYATEFDSISLTASLVQLFFYSEFLLKYSEIRREEKENKFEEMTNERHDNQDEAITHNDMHVLSVADLIVDNKSNGQMNHEKHENHETQDEKEIYSKEKSINPMDNVVFTPPLPVAENDKVKLLIP